MRLSRGRRWLESHLRALLFSVGEMIRAPLVSLMTLLVIGIAMSFPTGLYVLLKNVQTLTADWQNAPTISLYLKKHLNDNQVETLINQLEKRPDITQVNYISPAEGLKQFQQQSGLNNALKALPDNPLPGILIIQPKITTGSSAQLQKLLSGLSQLSDVETSELDTVWIERLYGFIQLGQRMTYGLMCLFAVGLALIVGNTMRMVTQNHQQAIKVLKLVGATQTFIRRPLLYQGALYGLFGGAIACLLVTILFAWLQAPAQHLVASYHSLWHLQGLSWLVTLRIIEWCALLGLTGSWLSTRYYLRLPEQV